MNENNKTSGNFKNISGGVKDRRDNKHMSKIFAEQNCECFATCVRCRYDFWLSEIEVPDGKSEELAHGVEQKAKADNGKLKLSLVPVQIIKDIAKVREYGCKKYKDPDNWKRVELRRYIDAFYRHWLAFIENPLSSDEESGLPHYIHCACNMAFICELMKEKGVEPR